MIDTVKNTLFMRIPDDAQKILNSFDTLIQGVQPLSSKQLRFLPSNIRELSHELTDERSRRRAGYMNEAISLSAYTRYFMWWNLVRLTSLFAGLPKEAFSFLQDGRYCLDIGSGPLTVPIALYLARPELRGVKLVWYCVDISQNALSLGENLLLSVSARLSGEVWNIIRIKGELGVPLKHKVSFVSCANMFNELYWNVSRPLEEVVKKYGALLLSYMEKQSIVFVAEPGIPRAARFISLLRDFLLRKNLGLIAPCTHAEKCPMDGRKGGKWCHFILDGETAPKALQKLSVQAGLPKDRASISFVCASTDNTKRDVSQKVRIISDSIFIPVAMGQYKKRGRYACASWGLSLVMEYKKPFVSGDVVVCNLSSDQVENLLIDEKSTAKIIKNGF